MKVNCSKLKLNGKMRLHRCERKKRRSFAVAVLTAVHSALMIIYRPQNPLPICVYDFHHCRRSMAPFSWPRYCEFFAFRRSVRHISRILNLNSDRTRSSSRWLSRIRFAFTANREPRLMSCIFLFVHGRMCYRTFARSSFVVVPSLFIRLFSIPFGLCTLCAFRML